MNPSQLHAKQASCSCSVTLAHIYLFKPRILSLDLRSGYWYLEAGVRKISGHIGFSSLCPAVLVWGYSGSPALLKELYSISASRDGGEVLVFKISCTLISLFFFLQSLKTVGRELYFCLSCCPFCIYSSRHSGHRGSWRKWLLCSC